MIEGVSGFLSSSVMYYLLPNSSQPGTLSFQEIFSENVGFALQIINTTFIVILPMVVITTYSEKFGFSESCVL